MDTCIWRKPTNTGLLLNYKANCTKTWISGVIIYFLYCAKNICSTCELYLQQLNKLRAIFQMSGYPNLFINDTIKKFEKLKTNTKEIREKDFCYLQLVYHIWENFSSIFQTA